MRFSLFQHTNGPVAILGESIVARKKNSRVFISDSNAFRSCGCANGGSMSIINFDTTMMTNCTFYNSSGLKTGGAFAFCSASLVSLKYIKTNFSNSLFGSISNFLNIDKISILSCNFTNAFGVFSGSFQVRNTILTQISNCSGFNMTTLGKGGFLSLNGFTVIILNLNLSEIASQEGALFIGNGAIISQKLKFFQLCELFEWRNNFCRFWKTNID